MTAASRKLALLRERVAQRCPIEREDERRKQVYVEQCAAEDARFLPYCACVYTELRRVVGPAVLRPGHAYGAVGAEARAACEAKLQKLLEPAE